jgi:hypothetical protein
VLRYVEVAQRDSEPIDHTGRLTAELKSAVTRWTESFDNLNTHLFDRTILGNDDRLPKVLAVSNVPGRRLVVALSLLSS